jgi:hypothetical protein
MWCARNRLTSNLPDFPYNTYEGIVNQPDAFAVCPDCKNAHINDYVKNAALAALLCADSTVDDYCYFFGRDEDNCPIWYEPSKIVGNRYPIVIGSEPLRNVFYDVYESVHNHEGKFTVGSGDIMLFYPAVPPNLGYWYDQ